MAKIEDVDKLLHEYNQKYNTQFKMSMKYALFPKEDEYGYTKSWPGNGSAGVYFLMSEDNHLIYVGQSKDLGQRFYQHFPPKENSSKSTCTFSENWSIKPYSIYVTTTPENAKWERLSLEEYLIQNLNPIDNKQGKI